MTHPLAFIVHRKSVLPLTHHSVVQQLNCPQQSGGALIQLPTNPIAQQSTELKLSRSRLFSTLNPRFSISAYPMAPHDSRYIYMGTITKPHGIRGEMSFHTDAEKPKNLMGEAMLAPPSQDELDYKNAKPVTVASVRMHHQMALITLEGVKDRTQAEQFRRFRLFIERKKLPSLHQDEFYQTDLLDLDVFVENLDDENYLGQLSSIDAPAGQELWTITNDDGKEILLPAVPEFVSIIDLDEEYIIITPPPGLIDIYLTPASTKNGPDDESPSAALSSSQSPAPTHSPDSTSHVSADSSPSPAVSSKDE